MDLATLPLVTRLLRQDCPESTKRALALMSGATLCFCLVILTLAIWYQAVMDGAVNGTLYMAHLSTSATVGVLAGVAYRKKEESNAQTTPPGAPDQGEQP